MTSPLPFTTALLSHRPLTGVGWMMDLYTHACAGRTKQTSPSLFNRLSGLSTPPLEWERGISLPDFTPYCLYRPIHCVSKDKMELELAWTALVDSSLTSFCCSRAGEPNSLTGYVTDDSVVRQWRGVGIMGHTIFIALVSQRLEIPLLRRHPTVPLVPAAHLPTQTWV